MSNIRLPNGLTLTFYRMDVGEVLIKVWGTERPLFKAEITHNGVGLDINVTAPVVAENEVVDIKQVGNIKEAVEWLSEQWDKRKAEGAQSETDLSPQHRSFVCQWDSLAAQNPPTLRQGLNDGKTQ